MTRTLMRSGRFGVPAAGGCGSSAATRVGFALRPDVAGHSARLSARSMPRRRSVPDRSAGSVDPMWSTVRREARAIIESDRTMARFVARVVLDQDRLEDAIATRIAQRLATSDMDVEVIRKAFQDGLTDDPSIGDAMRADLAAFRERDPACDRHIQPLLYFKGYHAIQAHRLGHWLWKHCRRDFALWLQSRCSEVFQTDINPAAGIGKSIFLDHATGLVVGSTAVIDDDVSILHGVTLGGTGKDSGDRHPKIRRGVLIGAGATILGNITVGACAKVAAGSVVLHPVPSNTTVAGVPARAVGGSGPIAPAHIMDQLPTARGHEKHG